MCYESSYSKHIDRTYHAVYMPIVLPSSAFHNILEPLEQFEHFDDILVNAMDVPQECRIELHTSLTIYFTFRDWLAESATTA